MPNGKARYGRGMMCAPVAIINALRWAGGKHTLKRSLSRLAREMECNEKGTDLSEVDFDYVLHKEAGDILSIEKSERPTLEEIETHLREDGAVLLVYGWIDHEADRLGSHATLYTDVFSSGKWFVRAEEEAMFGSGAFMLTTRKELRHDLRKRVVDDLELPIAWFLTKKPR